MALIKCPDCEEMISQRALSCPYCGCPAEFFGAQEEITEENAEALDSLSIILGEHIEFKLAGHTIFYPANTEEFAALYGSYMEIAFRAMNELEQVYINAGGIVQALKIVPKTAQELLDMVVENGIRVLYDHNVNFTKEQFLNKYYYQYEIDYSQVYTSVVEQYAQIREEERAMKEFRQAQRENRGRWQGGGFGVKGAVKGALTASVLNIGTDFVRAFGDSADDSKDSAEIRKKLYALYRNPDTKNTLLLRPSQPDLQLT